MFQLLLLTSLHTLTYPVLAFFVCSPAVHPRVLCCLVRLLRALLPTLRPLQQSPLEALCRRFLASLETDDDAKRAQVAQEAAAAFNLILEVVASVHLLEPYNPQEVRVYVVLVLS